jgi:hypothetical protein
MSTGPNPPARHEPPRGGPHEPPGADLTAAERENFDARSRRPLPRAVWAAGWVISAVLAVVLIFAWSGLDAPTESARDFRALSRGQLELSVKTGDPARLERLLARGELGFPPRVPNFEALGWKLAGGGVHRFARRPSALSAYREIGGRWLVCQRFVGRAEELPVAERRTRHGTEFLAYERDGVTSVFWREGPTLCVLASDLPREEVVQLAFSIAMKTI